MKGHWSDCAVNNTPALPTGPFDCGGLELALDSGHDFIPALVPLSGREGLLLGEGRPRGFIQPQQLPADRLMADAAPGNLPDAHDLAVLFGDAYGVDLNVSRIAVISKLKDEP